MFPCRSLARLASTLRLAQFLHDEKLGKESLRAFPPKNPPWGTGLVVRQAYGRPWFGANPGKQLLLARRTARQAVRCLPSRALVGSVAAVPGCRKPGFRRLGTAAAPGEGPDQGNRLATRASCHADLERWHKQKQQEVFRAVDMRCNASLVSRGVPRGERPRRLFRLFLAGQK